MGTCPACGTRYTDSQHLCPKDGEVLEPDQDPEQAAVGRVLDGKYRLDAFLSRGGMGAVYAATHLMLGGRVAVKLIKPALSTSSAMVRRFQREARAATQLQHPNIVRVYDLGQTDDGTLYIAMDLLAGHSLSDVIADGGPMHASRVGLILQQVLSALSLAHRRGVVHRDLKPQNIMIGRDDAGGEHATLLDFGIAKTFASDGETQLTATGAAIGTPHYMSPEQARGELVDARSDIYSVGVIIYEMLIGQVPFEDSSAPAILIKHLNEAPVRPSVRRPDLNVDAGLEAIAMRCLEKKAEDRFQSADDIAAQLPGAAARIRANEPTAVMPSPAIQPAFDGTAGATTTVPGIKPKTAVLTGHITSPAFESPGGETALATRVPTVLVTRTEDERPKTRGNLAAYAIGAVVLAGAAGAAFLMNRPASPAASSQGPTSNNAQEASKPPESPGVVPPVVVPPATQDASTAGAAPSPSAPPPSAPDPSEGLSQPAAPRRTAPADVPAPGDALSRALDTQLRALLKEQKLDESRLRSVRLEMTTRPSPFGRGITADYVATIRTTNGERTFPGNQLGFAEVTLRDEVVKKVAAEIAAFLTTP